MKKLILFLTILIVSCTPEVNYVDNETEITINYLNEVPERILIAEEILEEFLDTEEFKQFALEANYTNNTNGLSNEEIYYMIKKDWFISLNVMRESTLNRGMSYNNGVVKYRPYIADNYSMNRTAAIFMHEYMHHLGFDHTASGIGSVGYYFQYNVETFLNEYNPKGRTSDIEEYYEN